LPRHKRPKVARTTLELAIADIATAPPDHLLCFADPWPWTTGTPAAIADVRPIWAATAVLVRTVVDISAANADLAIRELNRRLDPGPRGQRIIR
jgi:hypothetical protein